MSNDAPSARSEFEAVHEATREAVTSIRTGAGQFWPPGANWYNSIDKELAGIWEALGLLADRIDRG